LLKILGKNISREKSFCTLSGNTKGNLQVLHWKNHEFSLFLDFEI
jgi:hypothetical protein